ncbi:hypothetical protein DH2020_016950 [Rehmannia glutinosa]|uniref:DNA-directed RNA polymerase RpoA/D/Rpb3-type domain-containing protein n=1 Tax=Rehmannia glutinosa TaxID=99300 RepID=A0ABR0WTA6_REHGL
MKEQKTTKVPVWDLPDVPKGKLPPHLQLQRTRVLCTFDAPTHTESIQYSGAYAAMGVDNSLRLEEFRNNFRVEVIKLTEDDMEFDMIGIDAALANAFRRILIAELPTMAIEKVLVANNTSVIQDEVLAHRLGLIPLKVDPRLFNYMIENDEPNEKNTIVFKLHARCERGSPRIKVTTNELKWLPNGSELILSTEKPTQDSTSKTKTYTSFNCRQDTLPEFLDNPIVPKHDDILIAKLGPGQYVRNFATPLVNETSTNEASAISFTFPCMIESPHVSSNDTFSFGGFIKLAGAVGSGKNEGLNVMGTSGSVGMEIELEAHAVKGVGKTHAKWSPVATAWYRMLPEVVLLQDIEDGMAEELFKKCPVGVFDIEDIGKGSLIVFDQFIDRQLGRKRATVARPRSCTLCRECIRGDDWDKLLSLRRVKDHFIFTIESTGALPPEILFTEAVQILEEKCERVISELS